MDKLNTNKVISSTARSRPGVSTCRTFARGQGKNNLRT